MFKQILRFYADIYMIAKGFGGLARIFLTRTQIHVAWILKMWKLFIFY
jgi:hypothetical protein